MAPFTHFFHPIQGHPSHGLEPHRLVRFLGQVLDEPHYTSHRRARHRDLLAPDFDVRETETAYYLEGEFPGIADKEAIKLEWVDGRTLAIDAGIAKIDLAHEWGAPDKVRQQQHPPPTATGEQVQGHGKQGESSASGAAIGAGNATASAESEATQHNGEHKGPHVRDWLCERRIGHYQRTFTFPVEVDIAGVRARLGQGLLRVMVPKVKESEIKAKNVPIENVEGLDTGLRT